MQVPLLVRLLEDEESAVRAASVGALMNITVDNEAKSIVLQSGGASLLIKLLDDSNEVCKLNVVKAIANTTELPAAREVPNLVYIIVASMHLKLNPACQVFLLCAQQLKQLSESTENKMLAQHALVAYEAVTWTP